MIKQLSGVIRENRVWMEELFSNHPEIRQIGKEFADYMHTVYGEIPHPRIVTGHQPVIYYPGLLFKDHFVGEMAKQMDGSAWNLVVDTDEAGLQVPVPHYAGGKLEKKRITLPNTESRAFSGWHPSRQETDHFFQALQQQLETIPHPQIQAAFKEFRDKLYTLLEEDQSFTDALTHLRNKQDESMGCQIRDHKIGDLVRSYPYAHYVWYIIKHIRAYTSQYNQAVEQGRRKDYQPVKTLHHQEGWYELPFWLEKDGKRLPVNLYKDQQRLIFRAGETGPQVTLAIAGKDETTIIETIRNSLVLYPKATTLTQVIRLFLSDIFVHGKGAVEYEKINNTFLRDFFSMNSKKTFFSVTGNMYLPLMKDLPDYEHLQRDYKRKQKWLKQVERNPEDHLENGLAEKYKEKKKAIARQMAHEESPEERRKHHHWLEQLDDEMKSHLAMKIEHTRKEMNHLEAILQKKDILYERQYPYFLYPHRMLTKENFARNIKIQTHQ